MYKQLKGVGIGAGYFSQFHYEAWSRISEIEISAICDNSKEAAQSKANQYGIAKVYTDYKEMLEVEKPDFIDIITPPNTHFEIIKTAANLGIDVICQKPLAPTFAEAREIEVLVKRKNIRCMVHENFRFQPWYRAIKNLLDEEVIGNEVLNINFRMRMGDGWQTDAYLNRQPYFREMPRLLIFETGVHFIDTFQYLAGPIQQVYAKLRRFNRNIKGEDAALVLFDFKNNAQGVFDASRYHESKCPNPRYTFGEMLLETNKGAIQLLQDGSIQIKPLGEPIRQYEYAHQDKNFSGDCVYFTQKHFVDALLNNKSFETDIAGYLHVLKVQEAIYEAAETGKCVNV
ncbi:Gfo/Idh/MocA family protein [Chondrinema litorale]|uniref:Gfo/Idh/MocA family protein n=1 Tax=Chondrinema litorale TaxID=2994555 RepID=UPI00254329E4|nr:Gfo/Idh/MocA family oxidoreductase [Chondrinema litorale]UZR97006.1 Gfo/Idh/MocA family oxidoreductase [Chondrinema litorale]